MNLIQKNDEEGKKASPVLPAGCFNYLVDIDGTICEDIPNEEPERMRIAEELPGIKEIINAFYDKGHNITFFTARTDAHRAYTEQWLKDHGFKYHEILFGKPRGGNYIVIDNHPIKTVHFTGDPNDLLNPR